MALGTSIGISTEHVDLVLVHVDMILISTGCTPEMHSDSHSTFSRYEASRLTCPHLEEYRSGGYARRRNGRIYGLTQVLL